MIKILVVEDDTDLNRFVCYSLRNSGYEVATCFNGKEALEKMEDFKCDLLLTDVMMPEVNGFELAESVRSVNKTMPIIFMTAKDDKPSKMLGYNIGIDEYVTKPFDIDILLLTIKAILRRAKIESEKEITIGNFYMNIEERTATVNGEEIALTVREFDILFRLLSYPKKTFTRSTLMADFWDYDSSATSRTVDVYMAKLREKTADCDGFKIVTVHGLGYKAVLQ
ncbi:MAG: response regulator transcription factor [Clostridiales bacterium]|nr:response regulator transcription factor [Clostridiales bacterium]